MKNDLGCGLKVPTQASGRRVKWFWGLVSAGSSGFSGKGVQDFGIPGLSFAAWAGTLVELGMPGLPHVVAQACDVKAITKPSGVMRRGVQKSWLSSYSRNHFAEAL